MQVADGDTIEVRIACYCNGQVAINVYHMSVFGTTGLSVSVSDVADIVDDTYAPLYKPLLANLATYHGVRAQKIAPGPPSQPSVSIRHAGPGTGGAALLPTQTTGLITARTEFAGPRYRGRKYIPFPAEGMNDDSTGRPSSVYTTLLNSLVQAYENELVAGVMPDTAILHPVIFHRDTETVDSIVQCEARDVWGTQRRRAFLTGGDVIPPF